MTFNFSWKNLVGFVCIAVAVVIGLFFNVPIANIGAMVTAIAGTVLVIEDNLSKTELKGWQKWVFLATLIVGVVFFTLGGFSKELIMEIIGAIVLIASVIFGVVVTNKK